MLTDAAYAQSSRFNSERLEPIRGQGATAAASAAAAAAATTAATTTTLLLRCDLSLSHLWGRCAAMSFVDNVHSNQTPLLWLALVLFCVAAAARAGNDGEGACVSIRQKNATLRGSRAPIDAVHRRLA
jgi:hypothetical protein